jgi:hypothetical protein
LGAIFARISCFGDGGVGETFFSMKERFVIIDSVEFYFWVKVRLSVYLLYFFDFYVCVVFCFELDWFFAGC